MLTNPGTPFTEEGFAAVVADLRRLFLLVGGGANDLNNASADVTQDGVSSGENANNAFKIRGVSVDTTAPTDQQVLTYLKSTGKWVPKPLTGITSSSTGTSLISTNNLSDVASASSSRTNLGVGTGSSVTFQGVTSNTLTVSSGASVTGALTCSTGVSVSKDLSVSSGTLLSGGLRTPALIKSSSYGAASSDYLIIVSGTSTITLPSASSNNGRSYAIGCYPAATVTVEPTGSDTIRSFTGVTLQAGKVHTFYSDGVNMWLEGRSA